MHWRLSDPLRKTGTTENVLMPNLRLRDNVVYALPVSLYEEESLLMVSSQVNLKGK